ncbi:component of IIS longevity pathway SMK-1-domain-containing protein [Syncephalis plumigaleata]|nr:component of IIS longevity pathway SMK-1-domain-containing protein [Syncephalis plumigaleata]
MTDLAELSKESEPLLGEEIEMDDNEEEEEKRNNHDDSSSLSDSPPPPSPPLSSSSSSSSGKKQWRVKVFHCSNEDEDWEDLGTGHCSIMDDTHIHVVSDHEEDVEVGHWQIYPDIEFEADTDMGTLISWQDQDNIYHALSFKNTHERDTALAHFNQLKEDITMKEHKDMEHANDFSTTSILLPKMGNLEAVLCQLMPPSKHSYDRDGISQKLIMVGFVEQLIEVFEQCEDLEDIPSLILLGDITRRLIQMGNTDLLQHLIGDETIEPVLGMLEYSSEHPDQKTSFRELYKNGRFVEVIDVDRSEIVATIHETHRLQFLKNVVLSRYIDDTMASIISSRILMNHVDIMGYFQSEPKLLRKLLDVMEDKDTRPRRRMDALNTLANLCSVTKSTQTAMRDQFYRTLADIGLFTTFEKFLAQPNLPENDIIINMLVMIIDYDATLLRDHILAESKSNDGVTILDHLIRIIHTCKGGYRVGQLAEMLKTLLGVHLVDSQLIQLTAQDNPVSGEFLSYFFDEKFITLLQPLLKTQDLVAIDELLLAEKLCDILKSLIQRHPERAKGPLLNSGILLHVTRLLEHRRQQLCGNAFRVIRAILIPDDTHYIRYFIDNNLIEPVFAFTDRCRPLANANHCACIELFSFLATGNIKAVLKHIFKRYAHRLVLMVPEWLFNVITDRYEQNEEAAEAPTQSSNLSNETVDMTNQRVDRGRRDGWSSSSMDKDEEDYFNDSDEDEENVDMTNKSEDDETNWDSDTSTGSGKRPRSGSNEDMSTSVNLVNLPKRPRSIASYDGDNDEEESWFDAISHYNSPPSTTNNDAEDDTASNGT